MAATYFGSAIKAGSYPSEYADAGFVNLTQIVTLQANGTGAGSNVDASVILPKNAVITDIVIDTVTANTSTTAALSVGVTAGGTEYVNAADVKAGGRVRPTFTAAQLTAMAGIGTNTTVALRLALGGTTTAVGTVKVAVDYIMTV